MAEHHTRAVVVLTPAESKRLLAKAVMRLPEVEQARRTGRLIVGNGTTNAYLAEELLGQPVSAWHYAAGVIAESQLAITDGATRLAPVALKEGKPFAEGWVRLLQEFTAADVFIKGGNAVDPEGNVGVLLASPTGGTVGQMLGVVAARGAHLIVPIGLEKLVPDVIEAAQHCGTLATDRCDGVACGMVVLSTAQVITELQALGILFGVEAWHLASGGVAGSEGAVTLAIEGSAEAVERAFEFTAGLEGEAPTRRE